MAPYRTQPVDSTALPTGIPYIIGNEAAERFSYYGMKCILTIFMSKYLLDAAGNPDTMSEAEAREWTHWFGMAVYFFPILGAILADWLLGKYRVILSVSLVYCAGHLTLAFLDVPLDGVIQPRTLLALGLVLIAIGSGGIKPCVTAHVGDQFGKRNQDLLSRVIAWFYFSINLGATTSTLLTPWLLVHYGAGWAFGIPGILMAIATFLFWWGRHTFVHIPPGGRQFFVETFTPDGRRALLNLLPLFLFVLMFWALFDQTASAWVLQAESMDRTVFGQELLSSQLQAANPILVMLFIPLFSYVIYPAAQRLVDLTPLRKIGVGMFLTVPAFAIPAWVEMRIQAGQTPSIWWQLLAYVVLTAAEIMVSITSLEFAYTQAPKRMKSLIMALYMLLSISMANLFVAMVNRYIQNEDGTEKLPGASYYWFFTGAMLLTAVMFSIWSQFYRGRTFIQGEAEAD